MNRKTIFAGAAGALLLGTVAIAQTPRDGAADATADDTYRSETMRAGEATSASEFGADTAEGTAMDRAGERG